MLKAKISKRLISLSLVFVILLSALPISAIAAEINSDDQYASGSYSVLPNDSAVNAYIQNKYSEHSNVVITDKVRHTPLDTYNYEQTTLNDYFNVNQNNLFAYNIEGSCTIVAVAIISEYMLRSGKVTSDSPYDINGLFYRAAVAGKTCGWDGRTGVFIPSNGLIVTDAMSYYTPYYIGDYSIFNMHSKYMDSYYSGVPILVALSGHTVCGVGIIEKTVTYKKSGLFGGTKTALETFIIVNDGWHDSQTGTGESRYQYVPFDDIVSIVVPKL